MKKSKEGSVPAHAVIMVGCFDTKPEEFGLLYSELKSHALSIIAVNTGVMGASELFPVQFEAEDVARAGGQELHEIRQLNDRGHALEVMAKGAASITARLQKENAIKGIIGLGGGGGTYLAIEAMKGLPFGIPKLCLSTVAAKDLSSQMGEKDIVLMPSVVDFNGINRISRVLITQAAAALSGMITATVKENSTRTGSVAISVFGNTTRCANHCTSLLQDMGYEVLAFHAVGAGGKTMESLVQENCFDAVLDLTTTELADELCGGICSAGTDRLEAAGSMGIPQVVVPGCLDMVNFGTPDSVPVEYKNRKLFSWAPDVTLMRTNKKENRQLGEWMAEKLNASSGPVTVVLPLGGLSQLGGHAEVFYEPDTDRALFETLKKKLRRDIRLVEVTENINTEAFAEVLVRELMLMLSGKLTPY